MDAVGSDGHAEMMKPDLILTPETSDSSTEEPSMKDGARMAPAQTHEYWQKMNDYWKTQPPGEAIRRGAACAHRHMAENRRLGRREIGG